MDGGTLSNKGPQRASRGRERPSTCSQKALAEASKARFLGRRSSHPVQSMSATLQVGRRVVARVVPSKCLIPPCRCLQRDAQLEHAERGASSGGAGPGADEERAQGGGERGVADTMARELKDKLEDQYRWDSGGGAPTDSYRV